MALAGGAVPLFDVETAWEVLRTGGYGRLPAAIRELRPAPPLPPARHAALLGHLETLILATLDRARLPPGVEVAAVAGGVATLVAPGLYTARVTLVRAPPVATLALAGATPASAAAAGGGGGGSGGAPGGNAAASAEADDALMDDASTGARLADVGAAAAAAAAFEGRAGAAAARWVWALAGAELAVAGPRPGAPALQPPQLESLTRDLGARMRAAADAAAAAVSSAGGNGCGGGGSLALGGGGGGGGSRATGAHSLRPAASSGAAPSTSHAGGASSAAGGTSGGEPAGGGPRGLDLASAAADPASAPLLLLHGTLRDVASTLALDLARCRASALAAPGGRLAGALRLEAARALRPGIRLCYWASHASPSGGPDGGPPALEIGLDAGGLVAAVAVPAAGGEPQEADGQGPAASCGEPAAAAAAVAAAAAAGAAALRFDPADVDVEALLRQAGRRSASDALRLLAARTHPLLQHPPADGADDACSGAGELVLLLTSSADATGSAAEGEPRLAFDAGGGAGGGGRRRLLAASFDADSGGLSLALAPGLPPGFLRDAAPGLAAAQAAARRAQAAAATAARAAAAAPAGSAAAAAALRPAEAADKLLTAIAERLAAACTAARRRWAREAVLAAAEPLGLRLASAPPPRSPAPAASAADRETGERLLDAPGLVHLAFPPLPIRAGAPALPGLAPRVGAAGSTPPHLMPRGLQFGLAVPLSGGAAVLVATACNAQGVPLAVAWASPVPPAPAGASLAEALAHGAAWGRAQARSALLASGAAALLGTHEGLPAVLTPNEGTSSGLELALPSFIDAAVPFPAPDGARGGIARAALHFPPLPAGGGGLPFALQIGGALLLPRHHHPPSGSAPAAAAGLRGAATWIACADAKGQRGHGLTLAYDAAAGDTAAEALGDLAAMCAAQRALARLAAAAAAVELPAVGTTFPSSFERSALPVDAVAAVAAAAARAAAVRAVSAGVDSGPDAPLLSRRGPGPATVVLADYGLASAVLVSPQGSSAGGGSSAAPPLVASLTWRAAPSPGGAAPFTVRVEAEGNLPASRAACLCAALAAGDAAAALAAFCGGE